MSQQRDPKELLAELASKRAAEMRSTLARARAEAAATSKEELDVAKLATLCDLAPHLDPAWSQARREQELERQYYVVHADVKTVAEFANLLSELARWT